MNSDTGFSCHQLDKDDVYQIDNSKSSCALFMIQGQVNLDLGEFYEGEMEQGQMLYIPQSIKAQIESITGSRCILLFWDKHISTCDKLFLSSLSIKENDTDTNDVILPIKKPLMNVLESVNRKRLLNYILCIRFFSGMHSIVSASQFPYTNLSQGCH